MALKHDPTITSKVKSIIIMGGGVFSGGNVTEFAEANIWNDPHAADEVFAADWEDSLLCVVWMDSAPYSPWITYLQNSL